MAQQQVISFSRLKVTCESSEGRVRYTFNGTVDDNFVFKDLKLISAPNVEFELSQVQHINSMGTREWILMLRQFNVSSDIHYLNCSVAMVDAFNSVPQLYSHIHIDSFLAPYFCTQCQTELAMAIDVKNHLPELKRAEAPEFKHGVCGSTLEFDALEESYFGFLKKI